MSIDNQLLFCYLEEDNIQQAYFRVRPLLTPDADIRQEAMNQFPVEGCLRIVPDRNEQHTFKSRMRDLGHYCLVDLANLPAEATKIRTNKNFRPDKGEPNQFILYSDTVHQALILISIMPLAANAVAIASLLRCHPEKTATAVLLSTVFAAIYVPVMVSWLLQ